ncbi:unnamed protein product [Litomosoides sigmodontis]|uniref:Uncharacterized protein n=1 Tax=Litomosoides sigmodontis TaxID=42156 RepID=A0A3P6TY69_LITSI|nr:unnamed protein product [Litomosoides sigmodontis]
MRLLCFDLLTFLPDLCRKNPGASSAPNANSDNCIGAAHERQTSIISSNALNTNYDDFVRYLQPEIGSIPVIDSCLYAMSSTPVPNGKGLIPLQIFEYPPPVSSHL